MFRCRGWDSYCVDKMLPRNTLEHDNEVKVHITYFLPMEASTKALSLFVLNHHYFSLYIYCSATNNLLILDSAAFIVPITHLK
jgi:hypothetical protein